jgi:subtilisin family serine protease
MPPRARASLHLAVILACCVLAVSPSVSGAEPSSGALVGPDPSWAQLGSAGVHEMARSGATAKLALAGVDVLRLDALLRKPATAPELDDAASDALLTLATLDLVEGKRERAEQLVRLVRARARNRQLAYAGLAVLGEVKLQKATAAAGKRPLSAAQQKSAVEPVLREAPHDRLVSSSLWYHLGRTDAQDAADVATLSHAAARPDLAFAAVVLRELAPALRRHRDAYLAAERASRRPAPRPAPPVRPLARGTSAGRPLTLALWDTGVDASVPALRGRLHVNERDPQNGKDDDGDGQIDDVSGLVFDGKAPHTALLFDPGEATLRRAGFRERLQGAFDLRAGRGQTDAAEKVTAALSAAHGSERYAIEADLGAAVEWARGTHLASQMLDGNPAAQLAVFRAAWATSSRAYVERGPTDAELAAERSEVEAIGSYIRESKARVVALGFTLSRDAVEHELRKELAQARTDEEIRARARVIHAHRKATLSSLFSSCPDALFVVPAGDTASDVVDDELLPAAIDASNLIAVGSVDGAGRWSTFTSSNPERVKLFAAGEDLPGLLPGGERARLSGTAMAAASVASLAGKLLVLDPSRSPVSLRRLLIDTATPVKAPFAGLLVNADKALRAPPQTKRAGFAGAKRR